METSEEITSLIPHRSPFLWVDKILSYSLDAIETEKRFSENLEVYKGHYPGNPITPGVILCEAIFQSGALLMGKIEKDQSPNDKSVPVLTRIQSAKFKRSVLPGDTVTISVKMREKVANVCFFKGTLRVTGKVAVQVEFACSLVQSAA